VLGSMTGRLCAGSSSFRTRSLSLSLSLSLFPDFSGVCKFEGRLFGSNILIMVVQLFLKI
jgi:hypothetical protein